MSAPLIFAPPCAEVSLPLIFSPNPTNFKILKLDPEIRRFCSVFLNNRGALEGRVLDNKYRRSPILKGGLKLAIALIVKKNKAPTSPSLVELKEFVDEYYIELEKMADLLRNLKPRREWLMIDDDLD